MATNHEESLPEEKYVEDIIEAGAGPRSQVSFCTKLLVKRLINTQSWCVAIKCLVILHRCILDGSFLFQDMLAHVSMKEGKDYLRFDNVRDDEYSAWVRQYARYLDERLSCARALKSHLDNRWTLEKSKHQMEFMQTEEILFQLEALQNLLQELCQCEAEEHPVIQGALVLVVTDSFKVYDEIRLRFQEMLCRAKLELSESLSLLHCCKRARLQMQSMELFFENCKQLRLFHDIPIPEIDMVSELEVRKLTETIQSKPVKPSVPLYTRRSSSVGRFLFDGGNSTAREPFHKGLASEVGQGPLQKTSSQRIPRLPSGINGEGHRYSYSATEDPRKGWDLIDLSSGSEIGNATGIAASSARPPIPMGDLITF
jgi:hypothetical protein